MLPKIILGSATQLSINDIPLLTEMLLSPADETLSITEYTLQHPRMNNILTDLPSVGSSQITGTVRSLP